MVTPMSCLGIVMQLAVMKMRGLASITASKMSLIVSVNIMSTTSSKRLSFESIYEFCSKILQSFSLIKHSFLFITRSHHTIHRTIKITGRRDRCFNLYEHRYPSYMRSTLTRATTGSDGMAVQNCVGRLQVKALQDSQIGCFVEMLGLFCLGGEMENVDLWADGAVRFENLQLVVVL